MGGVPRELQEEVAERDARYFLGMCGLICNDVSYDVPAATLLYSIIGHTCDEADCTFVTTAFRVIPSLKEFYKGEGTSRSSWIASRIEWLEHLKGLAEEI